MDASSSQIGDRLLPMSTGVAAGTYTHAARWFIRSFIWHRRRRCCFRETEVMRGLSRSAYQR